MWNFTPGKDKVMGRMVFAILPFVSLLFGQWLETIIYVGKEPYSICYNSRSHKVYSANYRSNSISVIDASRNEVIRTIPDIYIPTALDYNPNNNKVYCTHGNTPRNVDRLLVIDGETDQIIADIPTGGGSFTVTHNPQNNKVYVADAANNTITIIDGERDSLIKRVRTGSCPLEMCHNSQNNKIYCANYGVWKQTDSTVTVVDGDLDTVIATVIVGHGPTDVVYNPVNNKIYVGTSEISISIIDGETDSVVGSIDVGFPQMALCYNPLNNRLYASAGGVVVIDCESNQVIAVIDTSFFIPCWLFLNPINNKLYATNFLLGQDTSGGIMVIDCESNQIVRTFSVKWDPWSFAHNPVENRVYVSAIGMEPPPYESTIYVIRDVMGIEEYFTFKPLAAKTTPTINRGFIHLPEGEEVRLYDVTGKLIASLNEKRRVSLKGIKPGVYFLRIKKEKNEFTRKLIVQ
jgi:YVTN family beta-propeller protein